MSLVRRVDIRESNSVPQVVPFQRYGEIRGSNLVLARSVGERLIYSGGINCTVKLDRQFDDHVYLMVNAPGLKIRKENEPVGSGTINSKYLKVEIGRQSQAGELCLDKPGIVVGERFVLRILKKDGYRELRFFHIVPSDIRVSRVELLERGLHSPAR